MEPHGDDRPHLPGPSLWPVGFAVGVVCVLVGLVVSWPAVAVGAVITLVFGFLWVRDVTGEHRRPAPAEEAPTAAAAVHAHAKEDYAERFPRSVFLEAATLGIGGVIGGIVTAPVLGFMVVPAFVGQEKEQVDLGPVERFPEGEWRETTFLEDPAAGEVSRRTAYIRNNGVVDGLLSFTIISNRCAHLGCPVQANGPRDEEASEKIQVDANELTLTPVSPSGFGCPCHGGAYDNEGNRTAGPPVRALDRYEFSILGDRLVLGEPYSVGEVKGEGAKALIKRYPLAGPGQHVDGPSSLLYPIQPSDIPGTS